LITPEAPIRTPVDSWVDQGVTVEGLDLGLETPHLPVDGRVSLRFAAGDQGAVVCMRAREWAFDDLRTVKEQVLELWRQGRWHREDILVTSVMKVDRAWVMFSTKSDQTVGLTLSAAPPVPGIAELLKAVVGSGRFSIGTDHASTSGYAATLEVPGTPLFQAIRVRGILRKETDFVKGGESAFEEPTFGDEAPDGKADGSDN
jgi:hypothetical protein